MSIRRICGGFFIELVPVFQPCSVAVAGGFNADSAVCLKCHCVACRLFPLSVKA